MKLWPRLVSRSEDWGPLSPGLLFRCASRDSLFFLPLLFRYGDMRRQIGFEIRDMWYNLGEYLRLRATGSGVGPVRQRRAPEKPELRPFLGEHCSSLP